MQMNSFTPFVRPKVLLSLLCVLTMNTHDAVAQSCSAGFEILDADGNLLLTVDAEGTEDLVLCHTESNPKVLQFISTSQVSVGSLLEAGQWIMGGSPVFSLQDQQFPLEPEGTLTVSNSILDDSDCSAIASVTIRLVGQPSFVPGTTEPTCFGACDGSLVGTYDSGNEDLYTHTWFHQGFNVGSGDIIGSACAGSYNVFVSVTDDENCPEVNIPVILGQPAFIEVNINPSGPVSLCPGDDDITLNATVDFAAQGPLQLTQWSWDEGLSHPDQLTTTFTPSSNNLNQVLEINVVDANGCAGSASISLLARTSEIFGTVMIDGSPCLDCEVQWFRHIGQSGLWSHSASANADGEGSYEMSAMPGLTPFIMRLVAPADQYPGMPSYYYPQTHNWMNATIMTTGCDDPTEKNFSIVSPPQMNGNATITGGVYYQYSGKMQAEDPIPHIDVVVEKVPPGNALSMVPTDAEGQFSFSFVPESLGDTIYRFYVDMPGVPMISTHILTIGADDVLFEYIDFCLNEDSTEINTCNVLSVTELGSSEETLLNMFPNPAADVVRFRVQGPQSAVTEVVLIDLTGRAVHSLSPGTSDFEINLNGISAGLYTAMLRLSDGTVLSERLMVGR
jgi:hypothetical protein